MNTTDLAQHCSDCGTPIETLLWGGLCEACLDKDKEAAPATDRRCGRWVREPNDDGTRFGTWYYILSDQRWELQRRTGYEAGDDFGWYLFGPEVSSMGEFLGRRLSPAKLIAKDFADDHPGARTWVRRDHHGDAYEAYRDRVDRHGRA